MIRAYDSPAATSGLPFRSGLRAWQSPWWGGWSLAIALTGFVGCQPLQPGGSVTPSFSRPKPAANVSVLEILTVDVAPELASQLEQMWKEVDDQAIAVETRQQLDRNGFRAGVAASQLPAVVHALINASTPETLGAMPYKQVQSRGGESFDLDVAALTESLDWQIAGERGVVRSGSSAHAVAGFALQTMAFGDRSVQLNVTPRLRHGALHSRYTLEQNQFLLRPLLDETTFAELAFDCRVRVGQTLIIGATPGGSGLGPMFFQRGLASGSRILLIRLVQSPADELFAPRKATPSLVTPGIE